MKSMKMVIMGLLLLGLIATANFGATTPSKGQGTAPLAVRGFVFNEDGDPVSGANVTVRITGITLPTYLETAEDGFYNEMMSVSTAGEVTVNITARSGLLIGYASFVADFDSFGDHNITISQPVILGFALNVLCVDADGEGVANVSVAVRSALGVYYNVTTNETGHATAELPVGAYTWSATTLVEGLNNRTGSFNIVDRAFDLRIDLSILDKPEGLSVFGIEMSKYCLLIIVVIAAVALGYLFIKNMDKKPKKK